MRAKNLSFLTNFIFFFYSSFRNQSTDLRKLYYQAGVENKQTVFLFSDTQVLDESFLEDINNILSSGEVPNLYKPEEFEEVRLILFYFFIISERKLCPCLFLIHLFEHFYIILKLGENIDM